MGIYKCDRGFKHGTTVNEVHPMIREELIPKCLSSEPLGHAVAVFLTRRRFLIPSSLSEVTSGISVKLRRETS